MKFLIPLKFCAKIGFGNTDIDTKALKHDLLIVIVRNFAAYNSLQMINSGYKPNEIPFFPDTTRCYRLSINSKNKSYLFPQLDLYEYSGFAYYLVRLTEGEAPVSKEKFQTVGNLVSNIFSPLMYSGVVGVKNDQIVFVSGHLFLDNIVDYKKLAKQEKIVT